MEQMDTSDDLKKETHMEFPIPLNYRNKTDPTFVYVFIAAIIVWISTGIYGISVGYPLLEATPEISNLKQISWKNALGIFLPYALLVITVAAGLTLLLFYFLRVHTKLAVWSAIIFFYAFLLFLLILEIVVNNIYGQADGGVNSRLIICVVVVVIYTALLYYLRRLISLAINLIRESTKAIAEVKTTLFFPLIPILIGLGFVAFGIFSIVCLHEIINTNSVVKVDQFADKYETITQPTRSNAFEIICVVINIIGMVWTACLIDAYVVMTLSGTFGEWYWCRMKGTMSQSPLLHYSKITFKYHFGTLALGSFVLTLIEILLVILRSLIRSVFQRTLACFCIGLVNAVERLVRYFCDNIYIISMLNGTNFINSLKLAFRLLTDNWKQVYVLRNVTRMVIVVSQIVTSLIITGISYGVMYMNEINFEKQFPILVIIFIITIIVTGYIMSVLNTAVNTLFICYVQDMDVNDGSVERPYYVTQDLAMVFAKAA